MAEAKARYVTKITQVQDGVVLELNAEEAQVLHAILGRVGGVPARPRGHADSISYALYRSGVRRGEREDLNLTGYVYFN